MQSYEIGKQQEESSDQKFAIILETVEMLQMDIKCPAAIKWIKAID